jgi:hypothetical protein
MTPTQEPAMVEIQDAMAKPKTECLLFIDANQYLDLFRMVNGHKLLSPLKALKKHIFVPRQVPAEVRRNKVDVACEFLTRQFTVTKQANFGLPTHLFGESDQRVQQLRSDLAEIVNKIEALNAGLANLAHDVLGRISRSEDEVSVTLERIFARPVQPTDDEIRDAEIRKKFGSPPGKQRDPLGDELSWQQILSRCGNVNRLWLITRDSDYAVDYKGKSYLNSLFDRELRSFSHAIETFCFKDMYQGLKHFAETVNVSIKGLPTAEEAEKIKEEQAALPPILGTPDWSNAAMTAIRISNWPRSVIAYHTSPAGVPPQVITSPYQVQQPDYIGLPTHPRTWIGSQTTNAHDIESEGKPPGQSP